MTTAEEQPKGLTAILVVVNIAILGLAAIWLCTRSSPPPAAPPRAAVPLPAWPARCDQAKSVVLAQGKYAGLAVAADGGFWVGHGTRVERIGLQGEVLEQAEAGLPVETLAAAGETRLFAAGGRQIVRLEKRAGQWQASPCWKGSERSQITTLAVAGPRLLAADAGERQVFALDQESGQRLWQTSGETKFIVPSPYFALSVNPDGTLWVVNPGQHRLENCALEDGKFVAAWQPPDGTFSGCCNPARMAALSGDRFATLEKGTPRLRIFAPSGQELETLAGPDELVAAPFDYALVADAAGTLYLLDDHRDKILCFPAAGNPTPAGP